MKQEEIKQVIFNLLKEIAPDKDPEHLNPDDNIRHSLEIDSFDFLQFVIGLDEKLAIQTAEDDYGKIQTLRTLLDYVTEKKE